MQTLGRSSFSVCLLISLLIMGCADDSISNLESTVQEEYELWNRSRPANYSFDYEATGFSPLGGVWRISVEGETVTVVEPVTETQGPIDLNVDLAPTIDALYQRILQQIQNESVFVVAEFDPSYHYPINAYFDVGEEGVGFVVTRFQPE